MDNPEQKMLYLINYRNYDRYDSDDALLDLAKQKEEHAVSYYEKYKK